MDARGAGDTPTPGICTLLPSAEELKSGVGVRGETETNNRGVEGDSHSQLTEGSQVRRNR